MLSKNSFTRNKITWRIWTRLSKYVVLFSIFAGFPNTHLQMRGVAYNVELSHDFVFSKRVIFLRCQKMMFQRSLREKNEKSLETWDKFLNGTKSTNILCLHTILFFAYASIVSIHYLKFAIAYCCILASFAKSLRSAKMRPKGLERSFLKRWVSLI